MTRRMDVEDITVTIRACARCGTGHEDLKFRVFAEPPVFDRTTFPYWALCPTNGEPILLRVLPQNVAKGPATTDPRRRK